MTINESVRATLHAIRARTQVSPSVGLILGSGMASLARLVGPSAVRIAFRELPHWPTVAVQGHGQELVLGSLGPTSVAVVSGRAHCYEGLAAAEVAFPVRVLSALGVRALVLTSAAGSLHNAARVGDLLLIEDHINLMGTNPLVGPHDEALGPRFPDLTALYDPALRSLAEAACWKLGINARKGVYAAFLGPSYETPAEIRMARSLGADAVGMSLVPEAIVARQCGLRVLALSYVTNLAAGLSGQALTHSEVLATAQRCRSALSDLLDALLPALDRATG